MVKNIKNKIKKLKFQNPNVAIQIQLKKVHYYKWKNLHISIIQNLLKIKKNFIIYLPFLQMKIKINRHMHKSSINILEKFKTTINFYLFNLIKLILIF